MVGDPSPLPSQVEDKAERKPLPPRGMSTSSLTPRLQEPEDESLAPSCRWLPWQTLTSSLSGTEDNSPLEATKSKATVQVHSSPPPLGAPSGEAGSWRAGRWGRGWASTRCRSWKAAARGCRCAARWRGIGGPPWHGNTWRECWKMKHNQGQWLVRHKISGAS